MLMKDNSESFTSFGMWHLFEGKKTWKKPFFHGNCFTAFLEQNQQIQVLRISVANSEQMIWAHSLLPPKIWGVSRFWNLDREGVIKNCAEIVGLVERGFLLERGGGRFSKLFHQFSLRKACFHYYWNTFFVW